MSSVGDSRSSDGVRQELYWKRSSQCKLTDAVQAVVRVVHDPRPVAFAGHMRGANTQEILSADRIGEIAENICKHNGSRKSTLKPGQRGRRDRSAAVRDRRLRQ